ncbi:undecaprenyl-diphosphate phosphatase [Acetivibrio cellulolyticus]|uniref:undecaprenyl-diphosphate phosphatase n=1 Tax=Acetivibrio cellulolyticus TaxID=35830 RepID=UPI0001E2D913|nr:undecaprenyl-diphosphate phosphatase [Acetivibrio cellulolyticus]
MEIIKAIILGIIEGITEWLPISSTGHMILADEFIKLNVSKEFKEVFLVVIQLGAILAVIMLFWNKLFPVSFKEKKLQVKKDTISLWMKVLVAVMPAAIIGIPFDDKIDALFYNYQTVTATLIIYGILFILLEKRNRAKTSLVNGFDQLSYKTAAIIGIFQVLSLIPGTSRSGATILGAILIGCSREIAAEFSFFLAIPVMFGASLLKIVKFGFAFTGSELTVLLSGMIVAFVVSIFAIKFLMGYIRRKDFTAFGYYRIVLGLIVMVYFMAFR